MERVLRVVNWVMQKADYEMTTQIRERILKKEAKIWN